MKHFTVYNLVTGEILYFGECQDHMIGKQGPIGYASIEGLPPEGCNWIDVDAKKFVMKSFDPLPESYQLQRARAYPSVGDQLDVLWREMQALPLTKEANAMLKQIQAVKAEYPKP